MVKAGMKSEIDFIIFILLEITRLIKSCFNYQCLSVSEGLCLSVSNLIIAH